MTGDVRIRPQVQGEYVVPRKAKIFEDLEPFERTRTSKTMFLHLWLELVLSL
jgi:hypothetical protein